MKKKVFFTITVVTLLAAVLLTAGAWETNRRGGGPGDGRGTGGGYGRGMAVNNTAPGKGLGGPSSGKAGAEASGDSDLFQSAVEKLPKQIVSAEEQKGLLLLREEEKLARDVYAFLGEKWNARPFLNIAESEQAHMDYVKILLDRYNIADPIKNDARGSFSNPELARLYTELTAKGGASYAEAVKVGMLVEELDISDLEAALAKTDNDDIRVLYNNLNKGSRNHLRAFERQLSRDRGTYEPVYITKALYDKILNSRQETGGLITDPNYKF
jgi:hypothetical protein